jgi:hypothetical protein
VAAVAHIKAVQQAAAGAELHLHAGGEVQRRVGAEEAPAAEEASGVGERWRDVGHGPPAGCESAGNCEFA